MSAPAAETVARALEGKREGREWRCLCPNHDGHSLMVGEKDGVVLVHCHGGCTQDEVIAALRERGLWGEPPEPVSLPRARAKREAERPPESAPVAVWSYLNPARQVIAEKGRFQGADGKKTYRWRLPGKDWTGLNGMPQSVLPLYRWADVTDNPNDFVWFVEGEKCADAMNAAGFVAVSACGGAAQAEFGDALEVLRDREVILWPDADPPGKAFMRRVARLLDGMTAQVQFVTPDLPYAGDAADFLAAGGLVLELQPQPVDTAPRVEATDERRLTIRVPFENSEHTGTARFDVTIAEASARDLDILLRTSVALPGVNVRPTTLRMNVWSSSARETIRRNLDEQFGKLGWSRLLATACELIEQHYLRHDPSVVLDDVPLGPLEWLLPPILPLHEPSLIFADGGTGKTYLALYLAACIAFGCDYLGKHVRQPGRVLFVDYETNGATARRRLSRIVDGMGREWPDRRFHYWPGRGLPLAQQTDALARKVERDGIDLVIVDSAGVAVTSVNKPEEATGFFAALQRIGTTSLTIGHVRRADTDPDQPERFSSDKAIGTAYWHNAPRATFWLKLLDESTASHKRLALINKKLSDGPEIEGLGFGVEFLDPDGPVTFGRIELKALDAPRAGNVRGQIKQYLGEVGSALPEKIAAAIRAKPSTVRGTLRRLYDDGEVTQTGKGDAYALA